MVTRISSSENERLSDRVAGLVEAGDLSAAAQRRLLTALVRAYARQDREVPAVESSELTTDEAAITAAALMRAKDVTSFELAALFNV
jgi:polyhydroxyalkanoate synthesis regulator phasin